MSQPSIRYPVQLRQKKKLVNKQQPPLQDLQQSRSKSAARSTAPAVALSDYVRVVADPIGAPPTGIPDDNAFPVWLRKDVSVHTVTVPSTGNMSGAIALAVSADTISNLTTLSAGAAANTTAGFSAWVPATSQTVLITEATYYRVVSMAIEVRYLGAAETATGRMCTFGTLSTIPENVDITTLFDNGTEFLPIDGMFVLVRPMHKPAFGSFAAEGQSAVYPRTNILGVGLVGGSTIEVRITRNLELIPARTSMRYDESRHTACDMIACCVAANITSKEATFGPLAKYSSAIKAGLRLAVTAAKLFIPAQYGATLRLLAS